MLPPETSWKEAEESVLSCTAQIMNQAIEILRSRSITDSSYTFESKVIAGSTPGKHFRHVLDHLRILIDAIEDWQAHCSSSSTSSSSSPAATFSRPNRGDSARMLCVDYDSRIATKLPEVETSSSASLREFERTIERLYRVFEGSDGRLYSQPLRLCATTPFVVEMDSTVGRELWFCGLHAIHHYALARVILVKELGMKGIDDQFGVAPSTLVHREWRKESNRAGAVHEALSRGEDVEPPSANHTSWGSHQERLVPSSTRHSAGHSMPQPPRHIQSHQHQLKSKL